MYKALLLADLTTELSPALRLQRLTQALKKIFSCGAVVLLKKEGEQLKPMAQEGLVKEALGRRFKLAEQPRLAAIIASKEPVVFEPASPVPDPYDGLIASLEGKPLPVHDCMGISLHIEGKVWGALTLDSLKNEGFTAPTVERLKNVSLFVEILVRLTELEQERLNWRNLARDTSSNTSGNQASEMIAHSPAITQLLHELQLVSKSELPILLLGETGVGKEVFARYIHQHSLRAENTLHYINCAALPESLAESELFGHVKGAFSGASQTRAGRFEAANGATLFLDEVGELPLSIQAKLLRVLQSGEIQRLGSDTSHKVDVRILAATNRNLQESVKNGDFRADLYHRLSVYPLPIPPLRERKEDLLALAGHFLELNRSRLGLRSLGLSLAAEAALLAYSWPGNVRELEHVISRAALKSLAKQTQANSWIQLEAEELDLHPLTSQAANPVAETDNPNSQPTFNHSVEQEMLNLPLKTQVEICQKNAITAALTAHQHNWTLAAKQLQLDPSNLHKLAKRLGLKD